MECIKLVTFLLHNRGDPYLKENQGPLQLCQDNMMILVVKIPR